MIEKASTTKRKIIQKIVQDKKIQELIENKDIEYPEDLIYSNIFPYLKIDDTILESKISLGIEVDFPKRIGKNNSFKEVQISFLGICKNDFLKMNNGYSRLDLLMERICELLNWNSWLGFKFDLVSEYGKPYNDKFYSRELIFNTVGNNNMINGNRINK